MHNSLAYSQQTTCVAIVYLAEIDMCMTVLYIITSEPSLLT